MTGTSRIKRTFEGLKEKGHKGFIAYITAGDPSLEDTVAMVETLAAAGVDIVELGIPFSDPLADGRVNQEAATRALKAGATWKGLLDTVREIRLRVELPIVFFSYLNPVLARGIEKAFGEASAAGVDGILLLDLPVDEQSIQADRLFRDHGIDRICLVTPTTREERMAALLSRASGFVYCVSRTGVTGAQKELAAGVPQFMRVIRRHTHLPLALGFGISTPQQVYQASGVADAVVVGSAIVERFHHAPKSSAGRGEVGRWVAEMVGAARERSRK